MEGNNKNDNSNNEKSESIFNNEIKDFSIQIQNDISKLSKDFIQNKNENIKYDKTKIKHIKKLLEIFSTMKVLKEDYFPIELIDNLYIGSIGAASNLNQLEKNNITHILIAGQGIKKYFPDKFTYLQFNLLDTVLQNIKQYFDKANEFINNAINNNGKVLVHCHAGVSRSGAICIAYIMKYKKMKFIDALLFVRKKRQKINPNVGFIQQLREYEKELNI